MVNNQSLKIDLHADDYAFTVNTSLEMLDLMRDGVLDSISIIPNMTCYEECIDLLKAAIPSLPYLPKISVHLNLVEGLQLSASGGVSGNALITSTWKSLFLASYNPLKRKSVKEKLKDEISAQIKRVQSAIEECTDIAHKNGVSCSQERLRIDSHQHTHMIPVVWDALCECLEENNLNPEYIRNSKEPLMPFIASATLWKTYSPVNVIKNRILNFYSGKCDRYDRSNSLEPMYLWGLVMSGRMDENRVNRLYPSFIQKAEKDGRRLEILFHPGRMLASELWDGIPRHSADDFYLNANRDIEKDGARKARQITDSGKQS